MNWRTGAGSSHPGGGVKWPSDFPAWETTYACEVLELGETQKTCEELETFVSQHAALAFAEAIWELRGISTTS